MNGTLLATASWDGTARLWDVATQRQIGPPMSIGLNLMDGVAFSPDGKILATAGADGAARLWDIAFPRDLPRAVCAIAGRSLTRAEWNTYAPTESFQRTCP
jgi:WD40 repeat protein